MNPKAFGELVSADVAAAIDEIYPPSDTPDVLDRGPADHAAFASSRSRIYIGRSYDMNQLDTHAHGQGPPLIILGESGVGKSALLANWALRYSRSHPNELVLMHFIGASPYSVEWENTVRRLISELNRRLNLEIEIPDEPDLLGTAFARALSMAGTKRRVVVMIDGLDQLSDRTGAQVMTWLPKTVPANICLLISTFPGHCLDELTRRSWPTLCVTPLTEDERRQFIADYLKQYGKQLGSDLVNRIAQHFATGNPLYLRALLEELRLYGSHHTLAVRIDHYLEAPKADALFELILERFEQDYDRERPGLVRDAMTMVWAGRRGLAEAELLDLLGGEDRPLPPAYWTPLHLAADAVLINRSGLIGFAHEYLRQAVERRYLPQAQLQYTAHGLLATYFASCELSSRKVEELPWQLAEIRNWSGLVETFSNLPFLRTAWKANSFEVRRYWARMTSEASIDMQAVYGRVLQAPHEYHEFRRLRFAAPASWRSWRRSDSIA
jgi:AAA ATPase-like protein